MYDRPLGHLIVFVIMAIIVNLIVKFVPLSSFICISLCLIGLLLGFKVMIEFIKKMFIDPSQSKDFNQK